MPKGVGVKMKAITSHFIKRMVRSKRLVRSVHSVNGAVFSQLGKTQQSTAESKN